MNTQDKIRAAIKNLLPYLCIGLLMIICNAFVDQRQTMFSNQQMQLIAMCIISALIIVAIMLLGFKKLTAKKAIILLIMAGTVMRLVYVLCIDIDTHQYDVGYSYTNKAGEFPWSGWRGHMEYIYTLFSTHKLPVIESIQNSYQYYHPPFWHFVSSIWMSINDAAGFDIIRNAQSIQFLTCFCSCSIMVVFYRILQALKIEDKYCAIFMPLICFLPIFYIMGGCINNDILMLLLLFISVLYFIRWYKNPTFKTIIVCGIALGLGMMTKTSAVILAPVYAIFFLVRLFKNRTVDFSITRIRLWLQYVAFAIVSIPLGVWYPIRNLILYNQPLNYVLKFSTTHTLYCGDSTTVERFFSFPSFQFSEAAAFANSSRDYNIWAYMFKTSLFEEYYDYVGVTPIARVLFIVALVLGILAFLAGLFVTIHSLTTAIKRILEDKKNKECQKELELERATSIPQLEQAEASIVQNICDIEMPESELVRDEILDSEQYKRSPVYDSQCSELIFSLLWLVAMASYVLFNIEYPFGCTMDYRYITPTMLVSIVMLSMLYKKYYEKFNNGNCFFLKIIYVVLVTCFSVGSIYFYLTFSL